MRFLFFLFYVLIANKATFANETCRNEIARKDKQNLILRFDFKKVENIKHLSSVYVSSLENDSLLIIDNSRFIIVDLEKGGISTNKRINDFLLKESKHNNFPTQLIVRKGVSYICFPYEIFALSKEGHVLLKYKSKVEIYKTFISNTGSVIFSTVGSINIVGPNCKLISSEKDRNLSTLDYFTMNDGLGYIGNNEIYYYKYVNDQIKKYTYKCNGLNFIDMDYFIEYATNEFIVGYLFFKRDKVVVFSFNDNFKKSREINLSSGYIPTKKEVENDDDKPNFRIIGNSNFCYVLSIKSDMLLVERVYY